MQSEIQLMYYAYKMSMVLKHDLSLFNPMTFFLVEKGGKIKLIRNNLKKRHDTISYSLYSMHSHMQ